LTYQLRFVFDIILNTLATSVEYTSNLDCSINYATDNGDRQTHRQTDRQTFKDPGMLGIMSW